MRKTAALTAAIIFPNGAPVTGPVVFDMATGVDMGSYTSSAGNFTQSCIRVRNPAIANFFVDFRPDVSGDRVEVVFWNGEADPVNLTVASGHVRDLPSYNVVIASGGITLYSATIPTHHWATRWRYKSADRPVIRTAAQIYNDFFPSMSPEAARLTYSGVIQPSLAKSGARVVTETYTPFMPPDAIEPANTYKLGLLLFIETGGERAELGAMTEWAADYLLNGTETSLNAIRQHGEMTSSEWPFFLPDLNSGAPINFKQDLVRYTTYIDSADYGPYYRAAYTNPSNGWDFHEEDSHFQMHPYIAFALTEDAYFLEGVQYLQAYGMGNRACMYAREGDAASTSGQYGWGNLIRVKDGSGGINGAFTNCSYYGETRTVGNGVRNLAMAYKTAPANPPSWLLPQSYYASVSSDYSAVINTLWTTNSANLHAVFRQLGRDNYFQAFEQAYGLMGMAIADLVGMPTASNPSWLDQLTFYFGMIDGITNGTSGWNNQTPQPHDIQNNINPEVPASGALDFSLHNSWGSLYAAASTFVKNGASFPNAASPGNQQGGSMGNCSMIVAACAMAKSRGVAAATNAKAWMDTFIDHNYPNNADASMGIAFEMKCGFDGTSSSIVPPTNGDIDMPSVSLIVGSTHTATFTANGPLYNSPAWSISPAGAATLTPAPLSSSTPNVATCSLLFTAPGPFTLTCTADADPTPGANQITASLSGTVIHQEATSAVLTLV